MTGAHRKWRTAALARLRGSGGPGDGDRGLATVWAAMTTATLCAVFAVVLALGQVVVVRHRAGGAADLAALAAADRALQGPGAACGAAGKVAAAQGAVVVRCAVSGEVADVTARVSFGPYEPAVRSRAGPPEALPGPPGPAPVPRPGVSGPPATGPLQLRPPVSGPPATGPLQPRPPTPPADPPGRDPRLPQAQSAGVR
ncbi:Rv3654c family TadE-like protein [Streptomyces sp. NPDC001880]